MTIHKAQAEELLEPLDGRYSDFDRDLLTAQAQVHATLYLAEEQHIANLLAYVQLSHNELLAAAKHPDGWEPNSLNRTRIQRARAQAKIREWLSTP